MNNKVDKCKGPQVTKGAIMEPLRLRTDSEFCCKGYQTNKKALLASRAYFWLMSAFFSDNNLMLASIHNFYRGGKRQRWMVEKKNT